MCWRLLLQFIRVICCCWCCYRIAKERHRDAIWIVTFHIMDFPFRIQWHYALLDVILLKHIHSIRFEWITCVAVVVFEFSFISSMHNCIFCAIRYSDVGTQFICWFLSSLHSLSYLSLSLSPSPPLPFSMFISTAYHTQIRVCQFNHWFLCSMHNWCVFSSAVEVA